MNQYSKKDISINSLNKLLSILIFIFTFINITSAQTLTPRVICSGYGSGQGGGIKLNYTIGETFVTTLRSGNTVLTQGFHQPEISNSCEFELANGEDYITVCPCEPNFNLSAPGGFDSYVWYNSSDLIFWTHPELMVYYPGWYYCTATNSSCTVTDSVYVSISGCYETYVDLDGDGFGDEQAGPWVTCDFPSGNVTNYDDCDDNNPLIYPGAPCNDNDPCTINDLYQPECTCSGVFIDSNNDGVCDLYGCTDSTAFNYNSNATIDDGSCEPVLLCSISASENILCIDDTATLNMESNIAHYTVGSVGPAGGVIYYDKGFQSQGWRYLEAAPADISMSTWGCGIEDIYISTGTALGTGLANSIAIVNYCDDTTSAAYRCLNHSVNGYDDWHLPSFMEFAVMHQNLITQELGNFQQTPIPSFGTLYWTSSQYDTGHGWHYYGEEPWLFAAFSKIYAIYVRPVRYVSAPSTTYTWNNGSVSQSIQYNNQHPGNYTISCTVSTSLQSCTDSTVIAINAPDLVWYADNDNDGFGNPAVSTTSCEVAPSGYVANNTDCDDSASNVFPGAVCDDNNPCTANDIINADCVCLGELIDVNNNGVCDSLEICPSAPMVTKLPENITLSCEEFLPAFDPGFYMPDGSQVTVTVFESALNTSICLSTYFQQWIGVNECNDSTVVSRVITLVDEQAPFFVSVPTDLTIACTDPIPAVELPMVSDNCDALVDITSEDVIVADGYSGGYRIDRVFYATDDCGNQATETQYIHVNVSDTPLFAASNVSNFNYSCNQSIPVVTPALAYSSDPITTAADSFNNATTLFSTTSGTGTYYSGSSVAGDRPGSSPFVIDGSHSFGKNNGNVSITSSNINTQGLIAPQMSFRLAAFSIGSTTNGLDASDIVTVEVSANGGATYQSTARVLGFSNAFWGFNTGTGNASTPYDGNATPVNFQPAGGGIRTTDGFSTVTITDLPATDALRVRISMVTNSVNERWIIDNFKVTGIANTYGQVELGYTDDTTGTACQTEIVRQWTATNECGNSSTFVQNITVADTEAPVITYQSNLALPCDNYTGIYATATDNCDSQVDVVIEYDEPVSGSCGGGIFRHYSATDDCGNVATAVQFIELVDEIAPVITWIPENATVECSNVPSAPSTSSIGISDNCFSEDVLVLFEQQIIEGACAGTYTILWIWTAVDKCGNTSTATTTITVIDTTAPVFISNPENITIDCGDAIPGAELVAAADNCSGDLIIAVSSDNAVGGSCAGQYLIERVYTATDDCGNVATFTQNIFVEDTTAPIFNADNESIFTYECNESVPVIVPVAVDDCSGVALQYTDDVSGNDCETTISRVWTATDGCGNSSTFVQNITIADNEGPVFAGEVEIERPCDDAEGIYVTATDNCTENVEVFWIVDEKTQGGSCAGEIVRTYGATDACGNYSEFIQIIQLIDNVAPVCSNVPAPLTVDCGTTIPTYFPLWDDQCDNDLVFDETTTFQQDGCVVIFTTIYTATDDCGNVGTVSRVIYLVDTTAPVASNVPANQSIECSSFNGGIGIGEPTFTDNCNSLTLTENVTEEIVGCDHVYTYVWTATDECGNSTSVSATITVFDLSNPVFEDVPFGGTFNCDGGIDFGEATAYDACGAAVVTFNDDIIGGNCPQTYTIVRTWTATDNCGNTANAITYYNVVDNVAPVFTAFPADAVIECSATELPASVASTADNCDTDVIVTYVDVLVAQDNCQLVYERRYTAADDCGNSTTQVQMIYVNDTTPPVISGDATVTVSCDEFASTGVYVTADDFCGDAFIVILYDEPSSEGCANSVIRHYAAIDACNNASYFNQTIVVTDTEAPVASNDPQDATYGCNDSWAPAVVTFSDNCDADVAVVALTEENGTQCNMVYHYTWTATDDCGNTTVVDQYITVLDETAPVFNVESATFEVECGVEVSLPAVSAIDNCGGNVTITSSESIVPGNCSSNRTVVTTYTASDVCGNTSTISFTVNYTDTTAPVWSADNAASFTYECDQTAEVVQPVATDACSTVDYLYIDGPSESNGCTSSFVRSWIATDACGNASAAFNQTITFEDTTEPVLVGCPGDVTLSCDATVPAAAEVTATDNCDGYANVTYTETCIGCPEAGLTTFICSDITLIRSWTAIDCSGNASTCSQVITLTCSDNISTSCDDGNPCTVNDIVQSDCTCAGTFADADFDGTCDANDLCSGGPEPGSECNDRDDCTVDDMIQADCSCAGIYLDSDADGTCDAFDICADGPEPGMTCDDGNPCTLNDTVDENCNCRGTLVETAVSTTTAHACGPYIWNGQTYTVSGNYSFITQTVLGCDSIAQLALTVGTPTFSSQSVTNCGSYAWNSTTYSQSGTYTYVTTNSTGCPNTATLNLTVNNPSIAASAVIASANNVSAGTSVTLTVQGGSLGTGASWKWYRGSCGGTLVGTGSSITITANATDTYYVRAEGICNTTTCATITVNVLSAQCGPEVVSASSTRICSGSSTTLSVLGTLYPGAIWRWRKTSCSGIIVGTGANLLVSPTVTTTYYVRAEGGTCGITLCMEITIIVDKMPATPSVISGPTSGLCNAQNVTYSVTPVSTVQQYNWTVPPGITIVSGQGTASVTVNVSNFINTNPTNGNPAICVTAQNSCGISPIRCLSLTTFPATPASISGPAAPCINSVITYSCPAVFGASSYTWTVPTGWVIQSGQGTASITVLCNGTSGNVRVRANNSCGNSTLRTLACAPTVCGSTAMPMQLELWPNPTSERVFFAYDEEQPELFEIYDMMGRTIYSGSWIPEFDVTGLAGGIYFVRATSGGESVVKRMEVVR